MWGCFRLTRCLISFTGISIKYGNCSFGHQLLKKEHIATTSTLTTVADFYLEVS